MSNRVQHQILLVNFGSQTAHLIGRRIQDLGIDVVTVDPEDALRTVKKKKPSGIIFSGGPSSVYEKGAPTIGKSIFTLGVPILGICYGWQLTAHLLGGNVRPGKKEYGPTTFLPSSFQDLFFGLPSSFRVFESHGDTVFSAPSGFSATGRTENVRLASCKNKKKNIYGLQFHPEMHHTKHGSAILRNFITRVCGMGVHPKRINIATMIDEIRERVRDSYVIGAFSGGTDSAVAGALTARAIGKRFIPIYIDSGLMRAETLRKIKEDFPKVLGIGIQIVSAHGAFLKQLEGVTDPEEKRKAIGKLYIALFEKEAKKHSNVSFLLQGTTYADFIQTKGRGNNRSAHIKSHHNVGGLPSKMDLKLLEPLRYYYTDEVRKIGRKLGLPKDVVLQQPYPGPGHAVRIVGEVTKKRLDRQAQADAIVVEELRKRGWYEKVFQCWSVMTGTNSTGVKGDGRFYGEVVAVRVVDSRDRMTADWVRLPYGLLERISTRIVNEVPGVSRVVYDITTKPPATMEWE